MADSVCHVTPNFQWHNKLKFFRQKFQIFSNKYILSHHLIHCFPCFPMFGLCCIAPTWVKYSLCRVYFTKETIVTKTHMHLFVVKAKNYRVIYNRCCVPILLTTSPPPPPPPRTSAERIQFYRFIRFYLIKHLVIGHRQKASNFSAFHWSPYGSLVSTGQHFVTTRVVHFPQRTGTCLITESDQSGPNHRIEPGCAGRA